MEQTTTTETKKVELEITQEDWDKLKEGAANGELADKLVKEMNITDEDKKKAVSATAKNSHREDPFESALSTMANMIAKNKGKEEGLDEDTLCMLRIINKINTKGLTFSTWNACTPGLKKIVGEYARNIGAFTIHEKQVCSNALFTQLAQEMTMDKEWLQLQKEVAKANRMPEHMDIYGSVLYDKMVVGSLIRKIYLENKMNEVEEEKKEDFKKAMNTYDNIINTFLGNTFFINMMTYAIDNPGIITKAEKLVKRNVDDITFSLEKNKLSISESNKISTLYMMIAKKFNKESASYYIGGMNFIIANSNKGTTGDLQTLFVQHMMIGVIAYINLDAEVQTEFGKILIANFNRYIEFCKKLLEKNNKKDGEQNNDELVAYIEEALKSKDQLYAEAEAQAREKVETDLAKKSEEPPKTEEEVKEENSDAS